MLISLVLVYSALVHQQIQQPQWNFENITEAAHKSWPQLGIFDQNEQSWDFNGIYKAMVSSTSLEVNGSQAAVLIKQTFILLKQHAVPMVCGLLDSWGSFH